MWKIPSRSVTKGTRPLYTEAILGGSCVAAGIQVLREAGQTHEWSGAVKMILLGRGLIVFGGATLLYGRTVKK